MHDIQHLQRNIIYHFHKGTFLWMTCIVKTSITRTLCHSKLSRSVSAKYGLHEGYICCFSAEADTLPTGDQIPLMAEYLRTKDTAWMAHSLIAIRSRKNEKARLELLELLPIALERTTSLSKVVYASSILPQTHSRVLIHLDICPIYWLSFRLTSG